MKSETLGEGTSRAEVTNITPFGIWILILGVEKFLPFESFPWFRSAMVKHIFNVELPADNHLYWPELDIDLAVESIDHPESFPPVSKVSHPEAKTADRELSR